MVVEFSTSGRYLIFALLVLVIVGGGVFLAYRMSTRSDRPTGGRRAARSHRDDGPGA